MHEKSVKERVEMKTEGLCRICDKLEEWVECEMSKGVESVSTAELGMATDMLKDVYEAKEKLVKACYYEELMETMEEDSEYEHEERERRKEERFMYFPVQGSGSGSAAQRGFPTQYMPPMMPAASGGTWPGKERHAGKEGFSFDSYMEALELHPSDDQESRRVRMESLNRDLDDLVDMAKDVAGKLSPEEKQIWKSKISKILNA